jgi:hypothetical protein
MFKSYNEVDLLNMFWECINIFIFEILWLVTSISAPCISFFLAQENWDVVWQMRKHDVHSSGT